jgi:multidrug efflux pump subunit AcrA (membrane-fusion protein)
LAAVTHGNDPTTSPTPARVSPPTRWSSSSPTTAASCTSGRRFIAEITVAERTGVLLIPSASVTTDDGLSTVQLARDGTVDGRTETREVTTGETSGNQIEVTSGLEVGDRVVFEGAGPAGRPGAGGFELPEGFEDGELPGCGRFPGGGDLPRGGLGGSG